MATRHFTQGEVATIEFALQNSGGPVTSWTSTNQSLLAIDVNGLGTVNTGSILAATAVTVTASNASRFGSGHIQHNCRNCVDRARQYGCAGARLGTPEIGQISERYRRNLDRKSRADVYISMAARRERYRGRDRQRLHDSSRPTIWHQLSCTVSATNSEGSGRCSYRMRWSRALRHRPRAERLRTNPLHMGRRLRRWMPRLISPDRR